ncbi:MAG: hypothetical protein NTX50_10940 [Candidatus Sumerlaeota bacterium]|nr:hypothetical protein [Candidatus Sumerlaeota bacterium]
MDSATVGLKTNLGLRQSAHAMNRRTFLAGAAAAGAILSGDGAGSIAAEAPRSTA